MAKVRNMLRLVVALHCLALCSSVGPEARIPLFDVTVDEAVKNINSMTPQEMIKKVGLWAIQTTENILRLNPKINPQRITSKCHEDLLYMTDVTGKNRTSYSTTPFWQETMLDSYGKIPSGLIEGNVYWMGDFTQCTRVKVWKNTNNNDPQGEPDFKGKYCLPNINHYIEGIALQYIDALPIAVTYAICVPSTCTGHDVENLVNEFLYPLKIIINEDQCRTDAPRQYDQFTIYSIILFSAIVGLIIFATLWDVKPLLAKTLLRKPTAPTSERRGMLKSIVLSFSAYTNTKKLLNTSSKNRLAVINGVRAVSMMGVVAGHMVLMTAVFMGRPNPMEIVTFFKKFWAQPLIYGVLVVDTFYSLTAFLVVYGVLTTARHVKHFNILMFIAHRLWRLTPTYLLLAAFSGGAYHHLYTGPLSIGNLLFNTTNCRKQLWTIPLYKNVYFNIAKPIMCLPQCWYLDAEMALYIMSAILLFPIIKKHWTGPLTWLVTIIAAYTTVATITHTNNLQNIISPYLGGLHMKEFMEQLYITPWGRAPVFLVGMFFGYVYFHKEKNLRLSKKFVAMMWTFTGVGMIGCIYINYPFVLELYGHGPSHIHYVLFITFNTSVWGVGIGWIILSGATGYGGYVNKILSWPFFAPFGRLAFCAYMVHLNVITTFAASRKGPLYTDVYILYFSAIAINVVTMIAAWALCMMIESPSVQLEYLILGAYQKRMAKKKLKTIPIDDVIN